MTKYQKQEIKEIKEILASIHKLLVIKVKQVHFPKIIATPKFTLHINSYHKYYVECDGAPIYIINGKFYECGGGVNDNGIVKKLLGEDSNKSFFSPSRMFDKKPLSKYIKPFTDLEYVKYYNYIRDYILNDSKIIKLRINKYNNNTNITFKAILTMNNRLIHNS